MYLPIHDVRFATGVGMRGRIQSTYEELIVAFGPPARLRDGEATWVLKDDETGEAIMVTNQPDVMDHQTVPKLGDESWEVRGHNPQALRMTREMIA